MFCTCHSMLKIKFYFTFLKFHGICSQNFRFRISRSMVQIKASPELFHKSFLKKYFFQKKYLRIKYFKVFYD